MAETGMGIWYPNNYGAKADVLKDLEKMAESIDEVLLPVFNTIYNLEDLQEAFNVLTGVVRIWSLSAGFYKVAKDSTIYYKGTTDTTALSGMGDLLLFVAVSKDGTYKHWVMFNGTGEELGYVRVGHTTSSSGTYVEYKSTAVADLIEDLNETALELESTKQSLYQTQHHFVVNESEELRIWDLSAGVHYLDKTTVIYYAGATNTEAHIFNTDYGFSGGILIITDGVSGGGFTGKAWVLLTNGHYYHGEKVSNGFVMFGFTTETDGEFYEYAIEDLDNTKKAVKYLEHDVDLLDQRRTEQAAQIQELQQENALLKEQIPQGQATGEAIVLEDSSDLEFKAFGLGGNHKQEVRSGKNRIDLSKIQQTTKSGVTCAYDEARRVAIFNGTCTQTGAYFSIPVEEFEAIKDNTTATVYCLAGSIKNKQTSDSAFGFRLQNSEGTVFFNGNLEELSSQNPQKSATYANDNTNITSARFQIASGTVFTNFTVKVMVTDTVDTEYEEYGIAPSVKHPTEVKTVNTNVNIKIFNKNYFDKNATFSVSDRQFNYLGEIMQGGGGQWKCLETYIPVKGLTKYFLSGKIMLNSWTLRNLVLRCE